MTHVDKTVQNISLAIQAGDQPATDNYTPAPVHFDFIYGIETNGLTPFELTLHELEPGESTTIELKGTAMEEYFGNLLVPFSRSIRLRLIPNRLYLHITLKKCRNATPREIVRAMAQSVGYGGGCGGGDCGCGCD